MRLQMTGACANLPYQVDFGMAETEAKAEVARRLYVLRAPAAALSD
jgi:hypothetical protein